MLASAVSSGGTYEGHGSAVACANAPDEAQKIAAKMNNEDVDFKRHPTEVAPIVVRRVAPRQGTLCDVAGKSLNLCKPRGVRTLREPYSFPYYARSKE